MSTFCLLNILGTLVRGRHFHLQDHVAGVKHMKVKTFMLQKGAGGMAQVFLTCTCC